jgi:trigger factor
MKYTGLTADKIIDEMKPEAERRIKNSLVLEAVAKAENIQVSDEEFEEELKKMAEMYSMEAEQLKAAVGEKELGQMRDDIMIQKAVDFVVNNTVEK